MYDKGNLLQIAVGPSSYIYIPEFTSSNSKPLRCYHPYEVRKFSFDVVNHFVCTDSTGELVGTLRTNGRLIFW